MLKEHVRARVPKCLGKESRYLLPLRNPPFFGNLSHLLPNKVAQRFSHKSVRVNICPWPLVRRRWEEARRQRAKVGEFGFGSGESSKVGGTDNTLHQATRSSCLVLKSPTVMILFLKYEDQFFINTILKGLV